MFFDEILNEMLTFGRSLFLCRGQFSRTSARWSRVGRLGEASQALLLTLFGTSGRPYLPALPLRSLLRGADVHFLVFRLFIRTKKVRLLQQTNVATLVQPLYDRPLNPPCQRRRILECSLF